MATNCTYRLGEFSDEFFNPDDPELGEFFIGFEDCSTPYTDINCKKLLIYAKPYISSQREKDYTLLWDYIAQDLLNSAKEFTNKSSNGRRDKCLLYFNFQSKALIDYLLLFKEELSLNPTVDNYKILFIKYKIDCINKQWKCNYRKNTWLRDMLSILKIDELINLYNTIFYISSDSIENNIINYIYNPA